MPLHLLLFAFKSLCPISYYFTQFMLPGIGQPYIIAELNLDLLREPFLAGKVEAAEAAEADILLTM